MQIYVCAFSLLSFNYLYTNSVTNLSFIFSHKYITCKTFSLILQIGKRKLYNEYVIFFLHFLAFSRKLRFFIIINKSDIIKLYLWILIWRKWFSVPYIKAIILKATEKLNFFPSILCIFSLKIFILDLIVGI